MVNSSQSVSMKTYALALAIGLSPAVMQEGISCSPGTGDATLSALEVEAMGENQIFAFDSGQRNYDVWLPPNTDTAIVRAYSTDADSQLSYNFSKMIVSAGTLETIDYGYFPNGGGEITLNGLLPEGRSALGIHVRAPGGARAVYTVAIQVGGGLEYVVSPSGDDGNPGTHEAPFRTINRAAQVARPGDTITVQSGIYREWVRPARGGSAEDTRITYRAAPGADVRILGSEPATGWVQTSDNVWALELDESRFGGFNPFNTLTRHPECVLTETGDCWGWLNYGRWTHLGDVYIDGVGLTEKQAMGEVEASPLSWLTETQNGATTIWANFGERDPNEAAVELNHRPFAFFPERTGLGYITVKGFVIQNVATHWAPPGVFQPGAIGPNGGHHWVIEDNIVMYSKSVCISIGNPNGSPDLGASGYHVIRNNVIMRCGQSGITGQLWIKNSQIVGNHIEEINYRNEFGGAETAGIKHHWGHDLHIANNFIRSVTAGHGIWADFQNNNWRVEGNVILGAGVYAMMAEANQGPNLYANNIFVGGGIGVYSSRADAWVHNLIVNAPQTWVNQDYGGRLPVGDARWANNTFIGDGLNTSLAPPENRYSRNVFLDGAVPHPDDADAVIGNTPTDIQVLETSQGVAMSLQIDEATLSAGFPLVDDETLELGFAIDATVDTDFFGEPRSELSNSPGPFATLQPGRNEFTVYEYPPLYLKAQCFTDCDDSNDCTTNTCDPAVGCEYTPAADGSACAESNECAVGRCAGGACALTLVANGTPCTGGTCQAGVCTWYAQDFEFLDQANPDALGDDGWSFFANVLDSSGNLKFSYGSVAPNGVGAISDIVTGEGDLAQGNQQLVVYSDYNCCWTTNEGHFNGTDLVQQVVYQEPFSVAVPIPASAIGKTVVFSFDAKRGNINDPTDPQCAAPNVCDSTANAFAKAIDPDSGWATTSYVAVDTTNLPTNWNRITISLPLTNVEGQVLQFGFGTNASNFEPSGVFYDNVLVVVAAP